MASEISYIDAGDVRFRIARDGSKAMPPLMFSNSLGSTLEMWNGQIPVFETTHRVIRYDVRGMAVHPARPARIRWPPWRRTRCASSIPCISTRWTGSAARWGAWSACTC